MKRLLMVAYHFPPLAGSSGIHRSLYFARHLPVHGWQTSVLSIAPRAYENTSDDLLSQIPADLEVVRAFALDASRHMAIAGRYPGWMARPDRWLSWLAGAIPAGLAMIRRLRPTAIWSTYPIASAHLVGYWLAHLSRLPWMADFRDPMAHDGYPEDPKTWQSYLNIEKKVFRQAQMAVFSTPGAVRLYQQRYPEQQSRIQLIENGYDEDAFAQAQSMAKPERDVKTDCITVLHSGIVYPQWRNPSGLFQAIRQLLDNRTITASSLRLRFRAPVHEQWLAGLAKANGLDGMVEILPPVPYAEALAEMISTDALLVLQSADCNDQVPAKLYEYLRAGKPILGLADTQGDTAAQLRAAGMGPVCPLEAPPASIAQAVMELTSTVSSGRPCIANESLVRSASRAGRTAMLARSLDEMIQSSRC